MNVVRHVIFVTTIHQVSALFAGRGTDIVSFCNNSVYYGFSALAYLFIF